MKSVTENAGSDRGDIAAEEHADEFDVLLCSEGVAIFSWNTPDIQELARLLGIPQFDNPRWCG